MWAGDGSVRGLYVSIVLHEREYRRVFLQFGNWSTAFTVMPADI